MKTLAVAGLAGLLAIVVLAAYGGKDTTASRDLSKRKAVADDAGNLHVPDTYRTTYELLGSWAVAADQGQGSKQLHVVYASPGTIAAYRTDGRFPDGAVLVKEVFKAATGQMTTGTVSHAETLKGWFVMMKDSKGRHTGGATAGAGRGSMLTARQRQRRLITRRVVNPVMCRRELPIGFTSMDTRR